MKVKVIRDANGRVVATYESGTPEASVNTVLKPGHEAQEVEADENYKADIRGFYRRHSR
jgi:hypothetical protein